MKRSVPAYIALTVLGCGSPETPAHEQEEAAPPSALSANARTYERRTDMPNLEDNVHDDTLLIYTTHAMGDGTFIMAARHQDETPTGLRLCLYRPRPDSSAELIASSAPAYDSWTMLPVYFTTKDTADGTLILANFGSKESWGQRVFWLKAHRFIDLGFLDVAERGWKTEDDSTFQWRTSIAEHTSVRGENGTFEFTFDTDSVQLYDDLQGHLERMLPASAISYRCTEGKATLLINGQAVEPKKPI